jgi:hypothetical protein
MEQVLHRAASSVKHSIETNWSSIAVGGLVVAFILFA